VDSVMVDRLGEAAMGAVMDRGLGGTDIVSGWVRHGACDTDWAGLDGGPHCGHGACTDHSGGGGGHQGAGSHAQPGAWGYTGGA